MLSKCPKASRIAGKIAPVWGCSYNVRMAILLFTDAQACAASLATLAKITDEDAPVVLLCAGDGASTETELSVALSGTLGGLFVVDVNGDRFSRINFDALHGVILDLDAETLLSSPGRRLVEVLAQLGALREDGSELHLAFVGDAAGAAGGVLLDGVRAGLGLIPGTAVVPNIKAVADLRGLLESMSVGMGRLIALDAPVGLRYEAASDQVVVSGKGSALLVGFVAAKAAKDGEIPAPTARLHVVTDGMQSGFPGA